MNQKFKIIIYKQKNINNNNIIDNKSKYKLSTNFHILIIIIENNLIMLF